MTITTFNTTFQTNYNCGLEEVERIYAQYRPEGNTNLVGPIISRLNAASDNWQNTKKRTLIAVIHDGLPNVPTDTYVVDRAIVDYTRIMQVPNEVLVTLLEIGANFDGREFCDRLDDGLIAEGAKYDIIDTVDFSRLKHQGLVNALITAMLKH